MTQPDNAVTLGERLEAARIAAGSPSFRVLEREAFIDLGPYSVSNTTIAKYHHGGVTPEHAKIELVGWLARRYGVTVSSLSPVVNDREKRFLELAKKLTGWLNLFDVLAA